MIRVLGLALTVTCWLLWVASGAASHSTSFKISDYKPTKFIDFEWRLDGGASMGHEGYGDNNERDAGTSVINLDEYYNSEGKIACNLASDWRFRQESRQAQFDVSLAFEGNLFYYGETFEDMGGDTLGGSSYSRDRATRTRASTSTEIQAEGRFFVISDFSVSGILSAKHSFVDNSERDSKYGESLKYEENGDFAYSFTSASETFNGDVWKRISLSGDIFLGWGRVYEGAYAGTALFLIDELRYRGMLMREPTHDEMIALTDIVREYRLSHAFDDREFRSTALTALMANLTDHELIREPGAGELLRVEDVWDYFPAPSRRFGWIVRAGFGGTDSYRSELSSSTYEAHSIKIEPDDDLPELMDTTISESPRRVGSSHYSSFEAADRLTARLEYYRPLSTRWQLNALIQARYFFNNANEEPDYSNPANYRQTTGDWEYVFESEWHWYHDARNEIAVMESIIYSRETEKGFYARFNDEDVFTHWELRENKYRSWEVNLSVSYLYRLAASTIMSTTGGYTYERNKSYHPGRINTYHTDNLSFSVGLTHWLF